MTKAAVIEASQLADIDTKRAELCGILSQNLASTVQLLNQPIQNISQTIDQIRKAE
jgi:hypothetical protein